MSVPRGTGERVLLFTTCYNERYNIGPLLDEMVRAVPSADILVIDDNSPDGTWDVIERKKLQHPQLGAIRRPRKLGVGSAHKYALFYAMRRKYDVIVTMDADFSHDPASIPALLENIGPGIFVTGSRYCPGGRSSYRGYRNSVSRLGNRVAQRLLGLKIRELTTYFRAFDVESLKSVPFRHIDSDGYSYGMQLVYYLTMAGIELREVPINFARRATGKSKIPKAQLVRSALNLIQLVFYKHTKSDDFYAPDLGCDASCINCGQQALVMYGNRHSRGSDINTVQHLSVKPAGEVPLFKCLHCHCLQSEPAKATG